MFSARSHDGTEHTVLAIVATLELDPESHNYKTNYVEKLSRAARKYLANSGSAAAFVLMNRPRDRNVLIPDEAAPQFLDDAAPRNGMMPPPDSEMIAPPITE